MDDSLSNAINQLQNMLSTEEGKKDIENITYDDYYLVLPVTTDISLDI